MIQEFSVQNFLSIQDKQTISFLASSDKHLAESLIVEPKPGVRLLRMAMIYGANASGKSNLLQAIQAVWMMLFSPQDKEHLDTVIYAPFAMQKDKPTRFEITFWANKRRFHYILENDAHSVLYEKMMYTSDKGVLSDMYERTRGEDIIFGSTLGIKAKQRDELNRETLGNHTVLSTLNKKNIDAPMVMKDLYEWIKSNIHELGVYRNVLNIAEQAENNPVLKKVMLELLEAADLNISGFQVMNVSIPEAIIEQISHDTSLSESQKAQFLRSNKKILFTHEADCGSFQLDFQMESKGTQVYFRMARLLFCLNNSSCVIVEDELEESLHYDLLLHFLQTYLQASSMSQLIFTTHNQELLDETWLLRRDMIWVTEKDRNNSATELRRVSDMGIHKNVSLKNAYRIGKFGANPRLGSTLMSRKV